MNHPRSDRSSWTWLEALRVLATFCRVVVLAGILTALRTEACAGEIKLGILCTDQASGAAAGLLTAGLSAVPGVSLLERGELDRVVSEQKLALNTSPAQLKSGVLAGADGLLIMESTVLSRGVSINLRVVGTRRGATLGWWNDVVPTGEMTSWSKVVVTRLKPLVPKLLSETRTAPISFVGFTSPSSGDRGVLFEREVNAVFLKRLAAEPDLLVLERQRLLDLAFEKSLGPDDREFWTGAFILDGTIDPKELSQDSATIQFRLRGSDGKVVMESTVTGSRTNLSSLAEQFVAPIRRELKAAKSARSWDAAAEAARFYEEAEIAVRWGFWPEARAAADAAAGLGRNDGQLRWLRLAAYAGVLRPNYAETPWVTYKPAFGVLQNYTVPPSAECFAAAIDTANQLLDTVEKETGVAGDEAHRTTVCNALDWLGRLTLKYYMGAELRVGKEEKLAEMRATLRQVVGKLLEAPEFKRPVSGNRSAVDPRRVMADLVVVLLRFGPLWEETPEDGLKFHEKVRLLPAFSDFQYQLWYHRPASDLEWAPTLCGWKWADRQRAEALWEKAVTSWAKAPVALQPQPVDTASNLTPEQAELLAKGSALMEKARRKLAEVAARQRAGVSAAAGTGSPPTNYLDRLKPPPGLRLCFPSNIFELNTGFRMQPRGSNLVVRAQFVPTGQDQAKPFGAVWLDDRLWLFSEVTRSERWATEVSGGHRFFFDKQISGLDPSADRFENVTVPGRFLALNQKVTPAQFAAFADRLILMLEGQALIYERNSKSFRQVPAHLKSANVFQSGNRLFLYNTETVAETTPDLGTSTVLAAVRRRPALSPLDNLPSLDKAQMFAIGEAAFGLVVGEGVYLFRGDKWEPLPGTDSCRPVTLAARETLLSRQVESDPRSRSCKLFHFGDSAERGELWWSLTEAADPLRPWQRRPVTNPADPMPRYPFITTPELPAGKSFMNVFRTFFPFDGRAFSISFQQLPGDAQLEVWRTNHWRPVSLTVRTMDRAFPLARVLLSENQTVAGPDDLFIWNPDAPGVWRVSGKELRAALRASLEQDEQLLEAQRIAMNRLLAPYDTNHNGKLDPPEYPALAREPRLLNLVWSDLDQDHNNVIDADEVRFFDFSHDGALDAVEHEALLNAVAFMSGAEFLSLDKNGDGYLQEGEATGFCNLVQYTPGSFRKYDTSQAGRLDLMQWTALLSELLHRRWLTFLPRPVPLPAIPVPARECFLEAASLEHLLQPLAASQRNPQAR